MSGFNYPHFTPANALAFAARQAGLTLHRWDGRLALSRFGSRIGIRERQDQWWIHFPGTEDLGPFAGEEELMRAATRALEDLSARSRKRLVRDR